MRGVDGLTMPLDSAKGKSEEKLDSRSCPELHLAEEYMIPATALTVLERRRDLSTSFW